MAANGISTLTIASGSTLTKDVNPPHSNGEIVAPFSAIWSLNYVGALGATNDVSYKLYVTSLGIGSAFTLTSHQTGDFAVTAGNFLYDEYGNSIGIIKGNATIDNYMAKAAAVCGSLSNTIITAATYKGTWNAFTNTPTLTDGVGTLGDAYDTTVAGTSGAFPAYGEQDWRIYDGSVWQRVAKTTTTQWTITPATGGLADKEARQIAKLDIAQLKRRGYTLNADGTIASSVTPATTPLAQNIEGSNGANAFFFRPNNSTYAQIVAGWTVVGQPTWVVTSATSDPGDQYSTAVTITGGTFVSGQSYAFTGNIVTAGAPDTGAPFYRARNVYDPDRLPTQYSGYTVVDNANSGGLVQGRPWTGIGTDDPANAAEPEATAWVLMDGPYGDEYGFYAGQSWRKMAPGAIVNGKTSYNYVDETVYWDGTNWLYTNVGLGVVSTGTGGNRPWQAAWTGSYTGTKITSTYVKTTNYPSVP